MVFYELCYINKAGKLAKAAYPCGSTLTTNKQYAIAYMRHRNDAALVYAKRHNVLPLKYVLRKV
jgi:hypothetical protein